MKHPLIAPLALVAIAMLGACGQSTEVVNQTQGDPMEDQLKNAAPVAAPPMIKSSHSYRCKDNSLIFVDLMTDDVSGTFRAAKTDPATALKAPEAGKPLVSADGKTTVSGGGSEITYNGQACKAG
jgi:hypothetical protein